METVPSIQFLLLENVIHILSMKMRSTLKVVVRELNSLGFNAKWVVVNAYNVGSLHPRPRWFCLASRNVNNMDTLRCRVFHC